MKHNPVLRFVLAVPLFASLTFGAPATKIEVFKTRTCGCCAKWVEHLKANGFDVTVQEIEAARETVSFKLPRVLA